MATSTETRRTRTPRRSADPTSMTAKEFKDNFDTVVDNVETVIKGKTDVVRMALSAMLCEGHVLFEDLPGTG